MCVYSAVADGWYKDWEKQLPINPNPWITTPLIPYDPIPIDYENIPIPDSIRKRPLTSKEIDELRKILKKAKQQDIDEGNPDCELEEKKQRIRDLAKLLGYEGDIEFP